MHILISKVECLENDYTDFDDFVLFCRILNGLSVEINLFRRWHWKKVSDSHFP